MPADQMPPPIPPDAPRATPAGPAPSPCVGVCRLAEDESHCTGCLRTLEEIASWRRLDEPARHALLDTLRERRRATLARADDEPARDRPG